MSAKSYTSIGFKKLKMVDIIIDNVTCSGTLLITSCDVVIWMSSMQIHCTCLVLQVQKAPKFVGPFQPLVNMLQILVHKMYKCCCIPTSYFFQQ
jgi:hypothetical protein